LYIESNWEEISNITDVISETISGINEINNEEYLPTATFEPFGGKNVLYLIRKTQRK